MSDGTFNRDAERAVLGAVLLAPACLPRLIEAGLQPRHFYGDRHRLIFGCMTVMHQHGEFVDTITVTDRLRRARRLEDAGGPGELAELTASVPNLGGVLAYAEIVKTDALWRQRREAALEQLAAVECRDESRHEEAVLRAGWTPEAREGVVTPLRPIRELGTGA